MDPIEKAIRNALEKGETLDPAFRQHVYQSAESALTRSLGAHPTMTPADRHARIERLRRISVSVEQEFLPAAEPDSPDEWAVRPGEAFAPTPQPAPPAPSKAQADRPILSRQPTSIRLRSTNSRKPGPIVALFVFVTFFALVVMFGWLIWSSGVLDPVNDGGTISSSATQPESSSDDGVLKLGSGSTADEGWVSVFRPSDAAALDLGKGISAELQGAGNEAYVLLTPGEGATGDSVVTLEFGKGLLDTLRGKKIVIDIQAGTRAADGGQMSVSCDLAGAGACQRTRFRLDNQVSDNLLSAQLQDVSPEASGSITISPDIEGKGRPVELYSVRVRVDKE
ncbi:MAG: hypothetical protein WCC66_01705 [Rhizobiaceae bacterium]